MLTRRRLEALSSSFLLILESAPSLLPRRLPFQTTSQPPHYSHSMSCLVLVGDNYWPLSSNSCPYLRSLQGDFLGYCKDSGPSSHPAIRIFHERGSWMAWTRKDCVTTMELEIAWLDNKFSIQFIQASNWFHTRLIGTQKMLSPSPLLQHDTYYITKTCPSFNCNLAQK